MEVSIYIIIFEIKKLQNKFISKTIMRTFIFTIIIFLSTSCAVRYDYNSLSFQTRGDYKLDVLKDFDLKEKEKQILNYDNQEFEIYFKNFFVISGNQMPGGTYDVFVFIFKNNKLLECGVLEDFRRSQEPFLNRIAKFYGEIK